MLKLNDLKVNVEDKNILNGVNLEIGIGEIHAIMGQNGAGKSTICKVIMGEPNYDVKGIIEFNGVNIKDLSMTERARLGIFILDQSPIAIEGVTNAQMLRALLTEKSDEYESMFDFHDRLKRICQKIDLDYSFVNRNINEGMSGGERKKNELLHMYVLKPKLILLDEVDSGLDVDSLKVVSNSINEYLKETNASALIITHHSNIFEVIKPDYIHVLKNGKISKTGDINVALEIEKQGFEAL